MKITDDIFYVGVNDHETDLFEGQYAVPDGMSYNSYVIMDEKIAVMDTVDIRFADVWLKNLETVLGERTPDYLVIHHMEPDHSSGIGLFMEKYPDAMILSSAKSYPMMRNFLGTDFQGRSASVAEGNVLLLGRHRLLFLGAAMVHWPEVLVSYDPTDRVLFSADAFGKFGALDTEDEWDSEARRYYIGIVGKYGAQVKTLLGRVSVLDIGTICPLHGPVLSEDLGYYLDLYDTWASYEPEDRGVLIAYTSVYGNTKKAAEMLAEALRAKDQTVVLADLARCDTAEAVAEAFRYDRLVLATTTYNADIFPFMKSFIDHLTERNFGGRTVAFIENGSWAPQAAKKMAALLEKSRNLVFARHTVTLKSALDENSIREIEALAEELCL